MLKLLTVQFLTTLAAVTFLSGIAAAQDDAANEEAARQQAFESGFAEIVDGVRRGAFDRFIAAIDEEDFLERIFGLRLIDPRVKRDFRESFEQNFPGMVRYGFPVKEDGVDAKLLLVESRGNRGRAVVRFDLDDFQFGYHEYELVLDERNRVVIVDWIDFLRGERYTDQLGNMLIMSSPRDTAVRKLIDYPNIREQQLFQMVELLKAARDRKVDRYFEILEGLDDELKRQRITVLTTVHLAQAVRDRRMLRTALTALAEHFPEEPAYSLMLLDYYFPTRRYEEALQALQRLDQRLGAEDAAMDARLSAAKLVLGGTDEAVTDAEQAVREEPALELGWWSLLRAKTMAGDFDAAVAAIERLEGDFGHTLDAEALAKDPAFGRLVASEAFRNRGSGGP